MTETKRTSPQAKVAKIRADIAARQAELDALINAAGQRIGKIAILSGLAEVDITDKQLREAFKELAARFQAKS